MSAQGCIDAMIVHGAIRADAILFVHAHRAAYDGDAARFAEVAELAAATLISRERRIEATAQGAAFHRIASATAAAPALAMLDLIEDDALSYPDRKSTRLNSVTNAHLVCRLLLEKKK